jgi:hypothetical protein
VVDNRLNSAKAQYYFRMLAQRHRFVLVHLSDERYADDCVAYPFANAVIRNYWCRTHDSNDKVLAIPLGTMNGFKVAAQKLAHERAHIWSFAGNAQKSSRRGMLNAMSAVEGGYLHCSDSIGPRMDRRKPDGEPPLPVSEYAKVMSETVFAPCPAGWENLDSFRVNEALEAGCIPIVERRPAYDYFRQLFGEHPMITVNRWAEGPPLIAELRSDPAALEVRRLACQTWWQGFKRSTADRVQAQIRRHLA